MSENYYEKYKVNLPEGSKGPWKIEKFVVPEKSIEQMRVLWQGRDLDPGTYTRLLHEKRGLVMSDTPAEIGDCMEIILYAKGRVLINGLGLGMVVKALLQNEEVHHIDVVEIDKDLIDLVGSHYKDPRLTIYHADAFEFKPKKGERWDYVWHDIWDNICADNLEGMKKLHRKYGRRCKKQASWCRYECENPRC